MTNLIKFSGVQATSLTGADAPNAPAAPFARHATP